MAISEIHPTSADGKREVSDRRARSARHPIAGYRPDIDGLRMVAIVPVVLYHAGVPWLSGGFVGVDVFFVISGFLITQLLDTEIARGSFSIINFYERRARRILPALMAVILGTFVAGWFLLLPDAFAGLAQSAMATVLFVSNFWFWHATSDYFSPGSDFLPLLHTWSLAVEEQFYIVFPLLLSTLMGRSRSLAIGVVAGLSGLSLFAAVLGVALMPSASFYLAPARGWELGLGAMLALGCAPRLQTRWIRETVAAAGLCAIVVPVLWYDALTPFPGLAALPPCLGAAALILAGAGGASLSGALLSLRPAVFIGLISYSLYLWHWPILAFLRSFYGEVDLQPDVALAAVAGALAAATLSWAYVERAFRRRPPDGPGRRTIFALSGAGTVAVGLVAAAVWAGNGVPDRLSSDLLAALAAARDRNPERDRCFEVWPAEGLCRFGSESAASAPADFLLWGDSHADAIMPGVAEAARRAGMTGLFAGRSGCPPLLGVDRVDVGAEYDCSGFNAAVLAELRRRSDIPLVILMARWALAAEGYRAPNEPGRPALLATAASSARRPVDPAQNFAIFKQAMADTIAAIRSTGREVVILGGIPEIGWDVPMHLALHRLWGHPIPPSPTLDDIADRTRRTTSVFAGLNDPPGVRYVPLAPLMCNPVCRTQRDGVPLYLDDDHLTGSAAEHLLVPLFLETIWKNPDSS